MSLDLTPNPGAAPARTRIARHVVMELRLLSRQGEQLLLTLIIPLMVLIGGSKAGNILDTDTPLDLIFPGVLALAVVSMSFTSLAIATGFERRYGVLKHLGATPLSPQGLLWGKALAIIAAEIVQFAVFVCTALLLGWRSPPSTNWFALAGLLFLGTIAFAALALLLAGAFRAAITLALANLLFVLALAFGGIVMPTDRLPAVMAPVMASSPPGALGDGMRAVLFEGAFPAVQLVVLSVWAVVASLACVRWFRWE